MIYAMLKFASSITKLFSPDNAIAKKHDRLSKYYQLKFLRKLRDVPKDDFGRDVQSSMVLFVFCTWLSSELVWILFLPTENNSIRITLLIYLFISIVSFKTYSNLKVVIEKAVKFLFIVLLFIIYLVWLFKERPQTEEDIMVEGHRHLGAPYFSPAHEPGYFENVYAGLCFFVLGFIVLYLVNFLLGRGLLVIFKRIAYTFLKRKDPTLDFGLTLDALITIPVTAFAVLSKYHIV